MSIPTLGTLTSLPAARAPRAAGRPGRRAAGRAGRTPTELAVVEIDPAVADTAAMSEAYDLADGHRRQLRRGRRAAATARSGSPPAWSAPTPGPTSTAWSSAPSTSARRRSCRWTARSRSPGWSTAGSRRSGCPASWRLLVDARVLDIEVAVDRLRRTPLQAAAARPAARPSCPAPRSSTDLARPSADPSLSPRAPRRPATAGGPRPRCRRGR